VIVDYAHNAAGLRALGEVVTGLRHRYKRAICAVAMPGDRRDEDIIEVGRICGQIFDEIIFREDPATRGRPRGEVLRLLQMGAQDAGAPEKLIHLVPGEEEATAIAMTLAQPSELVVITPSDIFGCWKQVTEFERCNRAPIATATSLQRSENV
jgi:cyanophycin synthetase